MTPLSGAQHYRCDVCGVESPLLEGKSIEEVSWLADELGRLLLVLDAPDEPPAGVREPRVTRPSTGSGAAAVDPDA